MKFTVKDMDIATGGPLIAILNQREAQRFDLHHNDRILLRKGSKRAVAVLDIAESAKAVPEGTIGLFEEALDALGAGEGDIVDFSLERKPESIRYIREKLDGQELGAAKIEAIVRDIVNDKLTDIELTSYVTANYAKGMSLREVAALTKAMASTGNKLDFHDGPVLDLHCIGGVPGNRTTLLVVPILVAAGCIVPKTSSRAITSPAGTADTMEVLAPVSLPVARLKRIIRTVGGFIVWGGAVNLAPADDKIIRVEHPLSIDAEGQLLASIMAKKASVSATHLLVDIPVGVGAKVARKQNARSMEQNFERLGKMLGITTKVMFTPGSEPVGNGIGPVLEARDALFALSNDPRAPPDLVAKSISMAGVLLEFSGKCRAGTGKAKALQLLRSGAALKAMTEIVEAQGGSMVSADELRAGAFKHTVRASKAGVITRMDNTALSRIARIAGAPRDKPAGIYLHHHAGHRVRKNDPLFTIYSENKTELRFALDYYKTMGGVMVR